MKWTVTPTVTSMTKVKSKSEESPMDSTPRWVCVSLQGQRSLPRCVGERLSLDYLVLSTVSHTWNSRGGKSSVCCFSRSHICSDQSVDSFSARHWPAGLRAKQKSLDCFFQSEPSCVSAESTCQQKRSIWLFQWIGDIFCTWRSSLTSSLRLHSL